MERGGEHLEPTGEITLEAVKKRAVRGVLVLTGRTFVLSVVSLVATAFLTVFLSPSEFGVFWIVSAVVNFLTYFSDVGLAAALIQKKEKISEVDLKTTFSVQQVLVIGLLLVLFLATPTVVKFYGLSQEGKYLLYALGVSFFLSSLKTIPSVLLERKLEFGKLVIPQVLENLVYNLSAVFLAWQGWGLRAFSVSVVLRGLVGLVVIYLLAPWLPGLAFSKKSLKKLLSFGLPYQLNTFLAVFKDDGLTAFLGGILGPAGVGFLGWAQKWGQAPLRFFMDHVVKVTFPAFARMQTEKKQLERSVTKSISFICLLVFPTLAGLLVLSPILIEIIPRYEKWRPALTPLLLIGINTLFAAVTTQLTNLLNATGRIKTTFKLMIMWTGLSWLFIPYLAVKYQVVGAAAGYAVVGASSLIAIYLVRKLVNFSLTTSVFKPALATAVMVFVLVVLKSFLPVSLTAVWILMMTGMLVYFSAVYLILGSTFIIDVRAAFKGFLSSKSD